MWGTRAAPDGVAPQGLPPRGSRSRRDETATGPRRASTPTTGPGVGSICGGAPRENRPAVPRRAAPSRRSASQRSSRKAARRPRRLRRGSRSRGVGETSSAFANRSRWARYSRGLRGLRAPSDRHEPLDGLLVHRAPVRRRAFTQGQETGDDVLTALSADDVPTQPDVDPAEALLPERHGLHDAEIVL